MEQQDPGHSAACPQDQQAAVATDGGQDRHQDWVHAETRGGYGIGAPFAGTVVHELRDRGIGQTAFGDVVFIAYAGSLSGAAVASPACVVAPARRIALNGLAYTRGQFLEWYGGVEAPWDEALPVDSMIITPSCSRRREGLTNFEHGNDPGRGSTS